MHDDGLEPEAWVYASVVVPIVVTMSPVGALISSYLHRQVIASFLYVLDTVAIVSYHPYRRYLIFTFFSS